MPTTAAAAAMSLPRRSKNSMSYSRSHVRLARASQPFGARSCFLRNREFDLDHAGRGLTDGHRTRGELSIPQALEHDIIGLIRADPDREVREQEPLRRRARQVGESERAQEPQQHVVRVITGSL